MPLLQAPPTSVFSASTCNANASFSSSATRRGRNSSRMSSSYPTNTSSLPLAVRRSLPAWKRSYDYYMVPESKALGSSSVILRRDISPLGHVGIRVKHFRIRFYGLERFTRTYRLGYYNRDEFSNGSSLLQCSFCCVRRTLPLDH